MKAILLLSMLSVCLSAKAQFHTVAGRQPVCRIDIKKDLPQAEKVFCQDKESVSTAGKSPANEYGEWVRRYMSVSYPLKRITVTSSYGLRIDPFSKKCSRHNGIDLRAKGEEAYAMLSGVVVKVGYDRRSGNFVPSVTVVTPSAIATFPKCWFVGGLSSCPARWLPLPATRGAVPVPICILPANALLAAVRRVSVFADKACCEVAMNFSGLSLVLSGKDIDCSTHAEETVFCAYQGGNLRISFKAEFLKQTLENITTKEVQFKLSTQERAGVITPVTNDDQMETVALIMPILLSA